MDLIGPLLPELVRREEGRGRPWKQNLFAWLQIYRRIVVRYERHAENLLGDAAPRLLPNPAAVFMR